MLRSISNLEAECAELKGSLQNMQQQNDLLRSQVDQDKVRYSELELVLAKERNSRQEQHVQLQTLEKEKNDVRAELARVQVRLKGSHPFSHFVDLDSRAPHPPSNP